MGAQARNTVEAQLNLAASLAAAHFTAVRIWGGGVFMPVRPSRFNASRAATGRPLQYIYMQGVAIYCNGYISTVRKQNRTSTQIYGFLVAEIERC